MYAALKKVCRNVRWKTSVTQYEMNGLKNTAKLIREIESGTYKLSEYQEFEIYEPKKRHITATRIRDRQVQRSLCDNYLYEILTKSFIYSNGACQKGKGTDFVLKDFKKQLQGYYRRRGSEGYYLKCDIHHFFESINHDILKEKLRGHIESEHVLQMVFTIIDSFGEVGLGLGSQVSQLLALFYLDELDHIIKEKLKIEVYTRYMDDFILISESKDKLLEAREVIEAYLAGICLELNEKTVLQRLQYGVMYLHWKFVITGGGKVLMLPDRKRCTKRRHKLKRLLCLVDKGDLSIDQILQVSASMKSHLSKGNSYKARSEIDHLIYGYLVNRKENYHEQKVLLSGRSERYDSCAFHL